MNDPSSISAQVHSLMTEIKKYFTLQRDLFKIEGIEKMSILVSTLLLVIVLLILATGALFYFMFTLAYAIESYVGGMANSFCIIGGFYVLLIILVAILRNKLIINPVVRFLSSLFLQDK